MKAAHFILVSGLAGLLLAGCSTNLRRQPAAPSAADSQDEINAAPHATPANLPPAPGNAEAFARFAAGETYFDNEDIPGGIEQWNDAALADPANEQLVIEVARAFLRDKKTDKALAVLFKSARRADASAAVLSLLAGAQLQAGRPAPALASSKRAIQRQPDGLDGYACQSRVFFYNKQWAEALKTLNRAARQIRAEPDLFAGLGDLYADYLISQPKDAEAKARAVAVLDRAAKFNFSSIRLWQRLADVYGRLGEQKKAADIYMRLLSQFPDESIARDAIHEKLAGLYVQADDRTNAMKQLKAIVRDNPARYPRFWFLMGELAYESTNLTEAAEDFNNALHWDPSIEQAYYDLALVQLDLHQTNQAFAALDKARERFPKTFTCEFFSGVIHSRVKNYPEAIRHFKEAEVIGLATNPSRLDQRFYFQFGAVCERGGQFQQAAQYLQKCVDLAPDFAEALNYLGYMLADRGEQLPRARALIEKAVNLEPANGAYLDSLGWVFFKLHQPQRALPWLLKAMQYTPDPDATILDHLGEVYLALRQTDKAIAAWKKSLSIESNDDVKRKLDLCSGGSL